MQAEALQVLLAVQAVPVVKVVLMLTYWACREQGLAAEVKVVGKIERCLPWRISVWLSANMVSMSSEGSSTGSGHLLWYHDCIAGVLDKVEWLMWHWESFNIPMRQQ